MHQLKKGNIFNTLRLLMACLSLTLCSLVGYGQTFSSFQPRLGSVGTSVTLTNPAFTNQVEIKFNGITAPGVAIGGGNVLTQVPTGATTGPITVRVVATNTTYTSDSNFVVTVPLPKILSFTPNAGPPATNVDINGLNFIGTTAVLFNGTPAASFTVNSNTNITAAVPNGATTGKIKVQTPLGVDSSATNFIILQPNIPVVTSFTPDSGIAGVVTVFLTGAGFLSPNPVSQIEFNGVIAPNFSIISDNAIDVEVPVNAITGPIKLINPSGSFTTPNPFKVTGRRNDVCYSNAITYKDTVITRQVKRLSIRRQTAGVVKYKGDFAKIYQFSACNSPGNTEIRLYQQKALIDQNQGGGPACPNSFTKASLIHTPVVSDSFEVYLTGPQCTSAPLNTTLEYVELERPTLISATPNRGGAGTRVTLRGRNLRYVVSYWLDNNPCTLISASDSLVVLEINFLSQTSIFQFQVGQILYPSTVAFSLCAVAQPTITTIGPVVICSNVGYVTLESSPADKYFWSTGDTTRRIRVTSPQAVQLNVEIGGCPSSQGAQRIVQTRQAPVATIIRRNDTLIARPLGGVYRWSLNGVPVGGNRNTLIATSNGQYQLIVTQNGCPDTASILINALAEGSLVNEQFALSPNPTDGRVKLTLSSLQPGRFSVFDPAGKLIKTGVLNQQEEQDLDLSHLPKGIYLIQVGTTRKRLVLQ